VSLKCVVCVISLLPTPPTTASRDNMDNFRAHLLELRQHGSTVVSGRPMRGALGMMGITRQHTPSINFHSGTRRAVGSWFQRDVINGAQLRGSKSEPPKTGYVSNTNGQSSSSSDDELVGLNKERGLCAVSADVHSSTITSQPAVSV